MISDDQELGITESKEHSTGEWYAEVVRKANYAPEGMIIITRLRDYALWEALQDESTPGSRRPGSGTPTSRCSSPNPTSNARRT